MHSPRVFPVILGILFLAGCARIPPAQQPVEASSAIEFSMWRTRLNDELTREEWRWFDVAMQEFKYQLMLDQKVSGSAAIETAVREKIHGRTLADVMREGLQAHLRRKTAERDELEAAIAINAKRRIPPGDTALQQEFAAHQEKLKKKIPGLNAELATVQAELDRLQARSP